MAHKSTERGGLLVGSAIRAAADGTITFPLSSETPAFMGQGREILVHTPEACDLSWLNSGNAPLLDNHRRYDGIRAQIGVIKKAWLHERRLYVTAQFSARPDAQAIRQDILDGVVRNVSVGYDILRVVSGETMGTHYVDKWKPTEASIVPIPADMTVGIGRSAATPKEAQMPLDNQDAPVSGERKMPGVLTEAERGAAFEKGLNEVRSLASAHNVGNIGEAFIESAVRAGVVPSIEVFRGIVRSKLPEGVALRNSDIGLNPVEKRRFSVLKLARAMADGSTRSDQEAAAFEIEACSAARVAADREGRATRGAYTLPSDVMSAWGDFEVEGVQSRAIRAAIGTTAGANVIDTAHLADRFIDNLRNRSGLMRAGATMLPGLEATVEIPGGNANNVAAWLAAEDANVAESNPTFRKITLGPKDLGSYTDLTRRMLQQSSIAMEAYVRRQITDGIVLEIDRAGLYGTGATGQPAGVNVAAGIGSVAFAATATTGIPTRSELIDMQKAIAATNVGVSGLKWIMNTSSIGDLMKTPVDAGSGIFLMNDSGNVLLGKTVIDSNQIAAGPTLNDIWLGAWEDVLIGMWGSLDLDRDTAAKFLSGGIRLRGIQTVDIAVQRVGSFCKGT